MLGFLLQPAGLACRPRRVFVALSISLNREAVDIGQTIFEEISHNNIITSFIKMSASFQFRNEYYKIGH